MRYVCLVISLMLLCTCVFANDNSSLWQPYLKKLESDIKSNWHVKKGQPTSCSTVVFFTVQNDGSLLSKKIISSDCNTLMRADVLKAVVYTAPFAKFPKGTKLKTIDIEFTFDYTVHLSNNNEVQKAEKKAARIKFLKELRNIALIAVLMEGIAGMYLIFAYKRNYKLIDTIRDDNARKYAAYCLQKKIERAFMWIVFGGLSCFIGISLLKFIIGQIWLCILFFALVYFGVLVYLAQPNCDVGKYQETQY